MSQQPITHEELMITLNYLNYSGPLFSDLPDDPETDFKKGSSRVVASSAF